MYTDGRDDRRFLADSVRAVPRIVVCFYGGTAPWSLMNSDVHMSATHTTRVREAQIDRRFACIAFAGGRYSVTVRYTPKGFLDAGRRDQSGELDLLQHARATTYLLVFKAVPKIL